MAIGHWQDSFNLTNSGLPAAGTVYTVKNAGTSTLATLTNAAGTPTGASTFQTDSRGNGGFYASDAIAYDIYNGSGTPILTDVRVADIGGGGGGGSPTGAASGDLTGSYPGPTIASGAVTSAKIADGTITDADISGGAAIAASKLGPIPESAITNLVTDLANIGIYFKQAVQVATTAALPTNVAAAGPPATLTASVNSALPAIDGYTVTLNDRILVKNESTGANDGIYTATNLGSGAAKWVLTRASDADGTGELNGGATVPVLNGSTQGGQQWTQTTKTVTVGTTTQTWAQSNNAGTQRRPGHFLVAASTANAVWKNQADYVCTGTADDVKINAAITACGTAGGWVELTDGTFTCSASIVMKDNIRLSGQGQAPTVVYFPTDLGAGNWAIYDSGSGIQVNAPLMHDLQLVGPSTTITLGSSPANMDGLRAWRDGQFRNVLVKGFHSGITIYGDHIHFERCKSTASYYNLDYHDSAPTWGNMSFVHCGFDGPMYASVRIGGGNAMLGDVWNNVHLGFGPYGILKTDLAAGGAATQQLTMMDSVLNGLVFESTGNCAIKDISTGGGSAHTAIQGSRITCVGFSWNATYRYATDNHDWAVSTALIDSSVLDMGKTAFSVGNRGVIKFTGATASKIIGPYNWWDGTYGSPLFGIAGDVGVTFGQLQFETPLGLKGWVVTANGTVSAGDLLMFATSRQVTRNTNAQPAAGVALTSVVDNQATICAYEGTIGFFLPVEGSPTQGMPLTAGATTAYHFRAAGPSDPVYAVQTDVNFTSVSAMIMAPAGWGPVSRAAVTTYAPTTTATKSTTSTTNAALDTTNLRVASVIAPSTGNLVVHVTMGKVTTGTGGGMFCIFANGTRVGPHVFIPASTTLQNVPMLIKLTGLTAGTSYNIDLASHSVTSGQTTSLVIDDATTSTNTAGPTVIRVDPAT